ncbi:enoyl-CoA hydratase [Mycolicibacterium septicum DSM 44393]|uniref:Enoyl-CoA hydratase n=1 Tax=Mycolicibacterium septicum DSM 44393 TaxID=1341646 RepID=A0A7X6ML53_9MYCO|nr:enoyl-CoA hydratase [Mycolicibacterium septicum]NKZ10785.1 enoyl-CoA hydratase [Mycolicibacterium septicum DSM 44393]
MADDILRVESRGGVLILTLNRPEARNALSQRLRDALVVALTEADDARDVSAVVITGADPAFCAGLDLKEISDTLPDLTSRWPEMTKPVIGAVNGAAITGGLELALYCDILIASDRASFADTHTRVGLLPTWGMTVRLPQKVGVGMARRMSMTGSHLSAHDALRAGLVTEVVEHGALMSVAEQLASSIAANNQPAVRALLKSYRAIDQLQTGAGLWIEARAAQRWIAGTSSASIAAGRDSAFRHSRAQQH